MTHKEFTDSLKEFLIERGKSALLNKLILELPFLANPIINPFVKIIVSKLVIYIFETTEYAIYIKYVDFRADAQGREFMNHMKDWIAVRDGTNDEEKAKARERLTKAFDKLVVIQL